MREGGSKLKTGKVSRMVFTSWNSGLWLVAFQPLLIRTPLLYALMHHVWTQGGSIRLEARLDTKKHRSGSRQQSKLGILQSLDD